MALINIDYYSPAFLGVVGAKNDVKQYEVTHDSILFNCRRGLNDRRLGFRQ